MHLGTLEVFKLQIGSMHLLSLSVLCSLASFLESKNQIYYAVASTGTVRLNLSVVFFNEGTIYFFSLTINQRTILFSLSLWVKECNSIFILSQNILNSSKYIEDVINIYNST